MKKIDKDFINNLIDYSLYWAHIPVPEEKLNDIYETIEEYRINGFIHSFLAMCEGCSSANDFHYIDLFQGKRQIDEDGTLTREYFVEWRKRKEKQKETV